MGLTNLGKRESLGYRNGKFTACYLLGKLFQPCGSVTAQTSRT